MTCYDVDLVAFNFSTELYGGLFSIHSRAQGPGHVLNVVFVEIELGCNLQVRQIQTHQVKAQNPDAQRLMVSFEDGSREIVEIDVTALAMVPLASRLGLITSVSNNLGAAALWAAYAFRPSDVTDSVEAFGIVDQVIDLDEQSIALAVLTHGLSFRVRGAQHNYAKTMEKSRPF